MAFSLVTLEGLRRQKSHVSIYSHPASALNPGGAPRVIFKWMEHIIQLSVFLHEIKIQDAKDYVKPKPPEVGLPESQEQGAQKRDASGNSAPTRKPSGVYAKAAV